MNNKIHGTIAKLKRIGADMSSIAAELRRHHDDADDLAMRGALHRLVTVVGECGRNISDDIAAKAAHLAVTQ